MTTVLAAVDESTTNRPLLEGAVALAALLDADTKAVHVREGDGTAAVAEVAADFGVPLSIVDGAVSEVLAEMASNEDVVALVVGARDVPAAACPPGHIAMELVTSVLKPVLVIPPDAAAPSRLHDVLVPLDGTMQTAEALSDAISFAVGNGLDVCIAHVHDESCLPLFEDQPQHESAAWVDEFLRRYCAAPDRLPVVTRIGAVADEILAISQERETDLIMLAWKRDLALGKAAVVRELLTRSSVPLLLYPCE
jgi:nucleotide-binding universal stress UspA family protein